MLSQLTQNKCGQSVSTNKETHSLMLKAANVEQDYDVCRHHSSVVCSEVGLFKQHYFHW